MAWNPAKTVNNVVSGDEDYGRWGATAVGGGLGNVLYEQMFGAGNTDLSGALQDVGARPDRPGFQSQIDPKTGLLKGNLSVGNPADITPDKVSAGTVKYNPAAFGTAGKALVDRATSAGPSPWLQMQLEKQGLEQTGALNTAAQGAAGAGAGARTQLAMRGGLSGGARERLASAGARDLNAVQQGVRSEGANIRANLGIADEAQKMNLLGQAAGLETNLGLANAANDLGAQRFNVSTGLDVSKTNVANDLGAQQFNVSGDVAAKQFDIGNALNETAQQRGDALNSYIEQMKERAAGITGNSILQSGQGGKK